MRINILQTLQILVGLLLVVFGANGFLHFISMPAPSPEMGSWLGAIFKTGYLFPIISIIEILAGLAFLTNKFVALMSVILMPVMLNAFLAHLLLNDIHGIGASTLVLIVTIAVMVKNKSRYSLILKP